MVRSGSRLVDVRVVACTFNVDNPCVREISGVSVYGVLDRYCSVKEIGWTVVRESVTVVIR
jgi:hypothetical protein